MFTKRNIKARVTAYRDRPFNKTLTTFRAQDWLFIMMPNSLRGFNFHSLATEMSAQILTQRLIPREEHGLKVFDYKVPKRIFKPKRE
jgi:hypothetical protein